MDAILSGTKWTQSCQGTRWTRSCEGPGLSRGRADMVLILCKVAAVLSLTKWRDGVRTAEDSGRTAAWSRT